MRLPVSPSWEVILDSWKEFTDEDLHYSVYEYSYSSENFKTENHQQEFDDAVIVLTKELEEMGQTLTEAKLIPVTDANYTISLIITQPEVK